MSSVGVDDALLAYLRAVVLQRRAEGILRVAITGVDGVGKTRLADALAPLLDGAGLPAIRVSIDGFHQPRAVRYARGRHSPEGFYLDSFDIHAFRAAVLDPLGPGGDRRYRIAAFDHHTDRVVDTPLQTAPVPSVLLVDGIFLLRPELVHDWDLAIYLDAPFAASFARQAARDGTPADEHHPQNARYRQGQLIYVERCDPKARADIVVDYTDLSTPVVLRGPRPSAPA